MTSTSSLLISELFGLIWLFRCTTVLMLSDVCDDDANITFVDVDALLNEPEHDDDSDFYLPPHQRCAAHILNRVASHEVDPANDDAVYKKIYCSTMAKCCSLWNKTSCSKQFADIVHDKFQTTFIVPNATRWNPYFNAVDKVRQMLDKQSEDKVVEVINGS
jgi:hypothetical protein